MTGQPVLAADVGGTQMRAALVDAGGNVLLRRSAPTPARHVIKHLTFGRPGAFT